MRKKLFLLSLTLFIFFSNYVQAQSFKDDPFIVERKGPFKLNYVIKKSGFTLTHEQIVEYMLNDPLMYSHAKPLALLFMGESLIKATGTILTAWPLIQLEFTDKAPNLNLTYIGLGSLAVSIVLNRLFVKRASKAARFYNNGYKESAAFQLKPLQDRVGVALVF